MLSIYCRNCHKEKEQNEYNLCFQCRNERLSNYYKMKKPELNKRYCQNKDCPQRGVEIPLNDLALVPDDRIGEKYLCKVCLEKFRKNI